MSQPDIRRRGFARLFSDRRIGTRIGIGFACVLAIMVAASGYAYLSFGSVSDNFATLDHRSQVADIARDADRGFLALRRVVREYAVTGDDASIPAARKAHAELKAVVDKGLDAIKSPERHAKMKGLGEQVGSYVGNFDKVVELQHDKRD